MKKFIAFMIVALPLKAILSMAAVFWYANNMERAPIAPVEVVQPVQIMTLPTATQIVGQSDYASLSRIQLSFCYSDMLGLTINRNAAQSLRICAGNMQ